MSIFIPGYHAALQSIPAGPGLVTEVWIAQGRKGKRISAILNLAHKFGVRVEEKTRAELDGLLSGVSHQGIVVVARDFQYTDLEVALADAEKSNKDPVLVVVDHITDEGNLASIIRTSAFFGVSGIIIPKDRSARVSPQVLKRAVGCHLYINITRVVNLSRTLDLLNRRGYWIVGTGAKADKTIYEQDWRGPIVLVVGNEERGLSKEVTKRCHDIVAIPSTRRIDSLNVGVATGIVLAELTRSRDSGAR